jgi:histidine ammonia-lyase
MDTKLPLITIGDEWLTLDQVLAIASGAARVEISASESCRGRIGASHAGLLAKLASDSTVYGVTTGFGESCVQAVEVDRAHDLARNLVRFHGVGTGERLSVEAARCAMVVRVASLARGYSGVRFELLERLCELINLGVTPCIPSEGSVGASGDLTPLSYIAALVMGEREAVVGGETMSSTQALERVGLRALTLAPKESLAIMNGTSVMVALTVQALAAARRISRWTAALTAMMSQAIGGNPAHFDDRIYEAKPHPGQRRFAAWIRQDLGFEQSAFVKAPLLHQGRLQDRYSVRCAPQVVGVLEDILPWAERWLEIEVNGANDNPLIEPEHGDVLHGGNFYGGHACFVADALKNALANVADLLDRQMALLCSGTTSNGLPENLVAVQGSGFAANHGFKAMQIAASALTAEALKLASPASVFSRSTECHNQDKVSMGTIAARESLRIVELVERVAAIHTLALCQSVDLREATWTFGPRARCVHQKVRREIETVVGDRRQDFDIEAVVALAKRGELGIGERDV